MKKFISLLSIFLITVLATGCFKRDNLEGITIYTTVYPLEYITTRLYGEHSTIKSIYPNDIDIHSYKLTDKQIKDYSNSNMYIFNGLSNEKDYVSNMFEHNKSLKIIDASQSMEFNYNTNELWLDPSNFLMLSLNVKNGLLEYIDNHYLKAEIETNYSDLKIDLSSLDAKYNLLSESSDKKTLIVDDNAFTVLSKYGFTVISLDSETATDKTVSDVTKLINSGKIHYIYTLNQDNLNDKVKKIQENTQVKILELHNLANLTEKERSEKVDYISLANQNIDLFKEELYN